MRAGLMSLAIAPLVSLAAADAEPSILESRATLHDGFTFKQVPVLTPGLWQPGRYAMERTKRRFWQKGAPGLGHSNVRSAIRNKSAKQGTDDVQASSQVTYTDAQDTEYVCPVKLGSNGNQTLMLNFDTGSADLWVYSTKLNTTAQGNHTVYNPEKSETANLIPGAKWNISYGDGSSAGGIVYYDSVSIGRVTVGNQSIGVAQNVSDSFIADYSNSGLVGLAFSKGAEEGYGNTISINGTDSPQRTFFDNARSKLPKPLFAVDLKHNAPGTYDFGFLDPKKYTGDIKYYPADTKKAFWGITSDQWSIGDEKLKDRKVRTIIDTGTTLLLMPPDIVRKYYMRVKGAKNSTDQAGYVFPCDAKLPDLNIGFGSSPDNFTARIPSKYMNYGPAMANDTKTCFGSMQTIGGADGLDGIYGDIFLKAIYTVFEAQTDTSARLGFALKPDTNATAVTDASTPAPADDGGDSSGTTTSSGSGDSTGDGQGACIPDFAPGQGDQSGGVLSKFFKWSQQRILSAAGIKTKNADQSKASGSCSNPDTDGGSGSDSDDNSSGGDSTSDSSGDDSTNGADNDTKGGSADDSDATDDSDGGNGGNGGDKSDASKKDQKHASSKIGKHNSKKSSKASKAKDAPLFGEGHGEVDDADFGSLFGPSSGSHKAHDDSFAPSHSLMGTEPDLLDSASDFMHPTHDLFGGLDNDFMGPPSGFMKPPASLFDHEGSFFGPPHSLFGKSGSQAGRGLFGDNFMSDDDDDDDDDDFEENDDPSHSHSFTSSSSNSFSYSNGADGPHTHSSRMMAHKQSGQPGFAVFQKQEGSKPPATTFFTDGEGLDTDAQPQGLGSHAHGSSFDASHDDNDDEDDDDEDDDTHMDGSPGSGPPLYSSAAQAHAERAAHHARRIRRLRALHSRFARDLPSRSLSSRMGPSSLDQDDSEQDNGYTSNNRVDDDGDDDDEEVDDDALYARPFGGLPPADHLAHRRFRPSGGRYE